MKLILGLFFISGIIISGCIGNPTTEVPVVHVNITFMEKKGFAEVEKYNITQDTINYLGRPRTTQAESFPAIAARTMILKEKNSIIGPWETLSYKGNGTYSFNIGFEEDNYPVIDDKIHISIMVVDKKGERIGYFIKDIIWK